jgi:hypothetical protein
VDEDQIVLRVQKSAKSIVIANIVQERILQSNAKVTLRLIGLYTPLNTEATDSFQIKSFNWVNKQFFYYIDEVTEGLFVQADC